MTGKKLKTCWVWIVCAIVSLCHLDIVSYSHCRSWTKDHTFYGIMLIGMMQEEGIMNPFTSGMHTRKTCCRRHRGKFDLFFKHWDIMICKRVWISNLYNINRSFHYCMNITISKLHSIDYFISAFSVESSVWYFRNLLI